LSNLLKVQVMLWLEFDIHNAVIRRTRIYVNSTSTYYPYTSPNQVIVADRFPITNDIKLVDMTRTTADNRYCSRYQHCTSENLHDQRLYLR